VHYFPAGATLFGGEVAGGFQFAGKDYVGRFDHVVGFDTCTECHQAHTLEVKFDACAACHTQDDPHEFRISGPDYDGDGTAEEGIAQEIETLQADLLAALQAYTAEVGIDPIAYDENTYPYFFIDTNGNGIAEPGAEANYGNAYSTWTPALLRAAYNYQYAIKDPGGFAHNGRYVVQLLIDSIESVGGDVSGYSRP
jgi:hypothetical protein